MPLPPCLSTRMLAPTQAPIDRSIKMPSSIHARRMRFIAHVHLTSPTATSEGLLFVACSMLVLWLFGLLAAPPHGPRIDIDRPATSDMRRSMDPTVACGFEPWRFDRLWGAGRPNPKSALLPIPSSQASHPFLTPNPSPPPHIPSNTGRGVQPNNHKPTNSKQKANGGLHPHAGAQRRHRQPGARADGQLCGRQRAAERAQDEPRCVDISIYLHTYINIYVYVCVSAGGGHGHVHVRVVLTARPRKGLQRAC